MTIRKQITRQAARSAFTLMEILIVVAIIVVLAGVGAYYLLPQLEASKEDAARLKARDVEKAVVTFYTRYDRYPATLQELTVGQNGDRPILDAEGILDPWNREFQYTPTGQIYGGSKPEIYCQSPTTNKTIGNWDKKRDY